MEIYWFVPRSRLAPVAVRKLAWEKTMGVDIFKSPRLCRSSGLFVSVGAASGVFDRIAWKGRRMLTAPRPLQRVRGYHRNVELANAWSESTGSNKN